MKVSERWLREWVDPPISRSQLVHQLTMAGLEVASDEAVAPPLGGVVVGHVSEVAPHPDADRLRVCRVDVGRGDPLTVVCGATNVYAGMRAPVATLGASLAGGLTIRRSRLRGVESEGMLCSATELGLAESAAGLLELPPDAPIGADLVAYLGLDDSSVEVELTPNRGDCLSVAGLAREVGVLNRLEVTPPPADDVIPTIDDTFSVVVEVPADCPRYVGRVIRGVSPHAVTPLWMRERLRRSGLRSVSAVVDVTNYVLLELGQPMHGFDLDRLQGGIVVRRARPGERLTLLDGQTVELSEDILVIGDHHKPVAMAGIMGGADSAVQDGTTTLFLESAFFAPAAIIGRPRGYGLQTDSSYRFERGVDPQLQRRAMERATRLLLDIAGGEPGPIIEVHSAEHLPSAPSITLRASRIRRLLGVEVPRDTVADILLRLGMNVEQDDAGWRVAPPSFRFDVSQETDLIEEVARVLGYDKIPDTRPHVALEMAPQPEAAVSAARLAQLLVARGYQEVVTYSFVDPALNDLLDPGTPAMALANPLSSDMAAMRTSLWPGLLQALRYNQNRQQTRIRLFETGRSFRHTADHLEQHNGLGGVASGSVYPEQWGESARAVDFFDVKGDLESLLTEIAGCAGGFGFEPAAHPALHPGQCARIVRDGRPVGWLGALHPSLEEALDLASRVLVFHLDLDAMGSGVVPRFETLSKFPSIRRDIAIVVAQDVPAQAVQACVREVAGELLQELTLFDIYAGKGIDRGRKSLALGLTLQDPSRTLKDEEVDHVVAGVVGCLRERLGATLRE